MTSPVTESFYLNIYQETSQGFKGFFHLLAKWKGSVYALIWREMLIYVVLYAALSVLYRYVLFHNPVARESFEVLCIYCNSFSKLIPIAFLTGFYVTMVLGRWWDQFMSLPWPDLFAMRLIYYVPGKVSLISCVRYYISRSRHVTGQVQQEPSTDSHSVHQPIHHPRVPTGLQAC